MSACTSPRGTRRVSPRTISWSAMVTCRLSTLNSFIKANQKYKLVSWIGESSFVRGVAPSDFADCDLIQNRRSKIRNRDTPWCNGNTAPFGGVILGSNPSGVANLEIPVTVRKSPELRYSLSSGFMNELRVENLRVSVADQEIVRGLSLRVPRGEVHALMGPR